jgi:hypothetical protein
MSAILHAWCQLQCTSSSLRYVDCGPGHIECIYSSAYSDFNIHLNVSVLLLEISRQYNERLIAYFEPNTEHILPFPLCELSTRPHTRYLQLRIFSLQYFTEPTSAAIGDLPIFGCPLYCKLWAKYSAYPPVYAMWTVVPAIYKVFTAPHIWASIFSCRYHRCYCRYHIISMSVILQTWCQIQRTTSSLRYVNCGPGQIQCVYSSAYSDFNIQLQVSAANIVDITTIQCALYCKLSAKYSAQSPVYAMWSVVPAIYKVFTSPHIYASMFSCWYLRCYCRYHINSMRVILQSWCQIQRTSSSLRYMNCGSGHIQSIYSSW